MNNISRKQRKLAGITQCQLLSWTLIILIESTSTSLLTATQGFSPDTKIYDQVTLTQHRFLLMRAREISCLVLEAVGGIARCNPTCEDILIVSWCCWPCSEGPALWLLDVALQFRPLSGRDGREVSVPGSWNDSRRPVQHQCLVLRCCTRINLGFWNSSMSRRARAGVSLSPYTHISGWKVGTFFLLPAVCSWACMAKSHEQTGSGRWVKSE